MQVDIFMAGGGGWGAWVKKGDVALQKSSKILRNIFAVDMAKKLLSCYAWQMITKITPSLAVLSIFFHTSQNQKYSGDVFWQGP